MILDWINLRLSTTHSGVGTIIFSEGKGVTANLTCLLKGNVGLGCVHGEFFLHVLEVGVLARLDISASRYYTLLFKNIFARDRLAFGLSLHSLLNQLEVICVID